MRSWTSTLLPRISAFVVLGLFATATLTYAAEKRITAAAPAATTAPAVTPDVIVVPDVRGQAYVFAEGILEDDGFAWRVPGGNGYAANTVVGQSPLPGTRVIDTGAPGVTLTLGKSSSYPQRGTPVNVSPFRPTVVRLADLAAATVPATTPPATPKPAVAPKKAAAAPKPAQRTPDFVVPGAPKEPAKEMLLVKRAQLLGVWLTTHKTRTPANVQHWSYQHAWIVTGAKFGWSHGAKALEILIQDDRRAQSLWGVGAGSEAVARAALAEVEAKAKS
jgi:hypothetical protein